MRLSRKVLKYLLALFAVAPLGLYQHYDAPLQGPPSAPPAAESSGAGTGWRAGQWLQVTGTVQRLLSDDDEGSRHQRFILRLAEGRTLLIAHNIDLAPRLPLRQGDSVGCAGATSTMTAAAWFTGLTTIRAGSRTAAGSSTAEGCIVGREI